MIYSLFFNLFFATVRLRQDSALIKDTKLTGEKINERVEETLEDVGLKGMEHKYTAEISYAIR